MTHGPDSPPAGAEPDPRRAEGGTGAEADGADPKPTMTEERSPCRRADIDIDIDITLNGHTDP